MKPKSECIYCIDTSALVTMHRFYPLRMLRDLWKHLEELFKVKKILSHDFVYDEIVPEAGTKDDLAKLVARHKFCFRPITKRQALLVPQILSLFPHLIDPRSKKDQADPWIISMVIAMMEKISLFGNDSDYVIVSTESESSPNKIPAVCKHFEDNGWQFSLSKKI